MPTTEQNLYTRYRTEMLQWANSAPGAARPTPPDTRSASYAIYRQATMDVAETLVLDRDPAAKAAYGRAFGEVGTNSGEISVRIGDGNRYFEAGARPTFNADGNTTLDGRETKRQQGWSENVAVNAAAAVGSTYTALLQGTRPTAAQRRIADRDFSMDGDRVTQILNVINAGRDESGLASLGAAAASVQRNENQRREEAAAVTTREQETARINRIPPTERAVELLTTGAYASRRAAVNEIILAEANSGESDAHLQYRLFSQARELERAGDDSAVNYRIAGAAISRATRIRGDATARFEAIQNPVEFVNARVAEVLAQPEPSATVAPRAAAAPAATAPATPASAAPAANARMLDISDNSVTPMQLAYNEIVPQWRPNGAAPTDEYTDHLNTLMHGIGNTPVDDTMLVRLYNASEQYRVAGDELNYRAGRAALTVARRGNYIHAQRETGVEQIPAVTNAVAQFNVAWTNTARLAGAPASAETTPAVDEAATAPAAGAGAAATPPAAGGGTPRSATAEARESADAALTDDALLAYVRGETAVTDRNGAEQRHGNLFRGAQNINPSQFDPMIKDLQQSLDRVTEGGLRYGADGVYGGATVNAVRALQEEYGLRVDGVAGRLTVTALQVEEAQFLINHLKEGGLTDAEKLEIQKELGDVQTMLNGQTRVPARILQQLTSALDGLKEATGGTDVAEGTLGTTITALRAATAPAVTPAPTTPAASTAPTTVSGGESTQGPAGGAPSALPTPTPTLQEESNFR